MENGNAWPFTLPCSFILAPLYTPQALQFNLVRGLAIPTSLGKCSICMESHANQLLNFCLT